MIRRFKYDVAISVAEEDKGIAQQIAAELHKKAIRYYYYEERTVESWGEYIINLTRDAFGRHTRYVLMITSKHFTKKYWSGIERQMAFTSPVHGKPHILQLRLDDSQVDGISQHIAHIDWNANPIEITDLLIQKIKKQQRQEVSRLGKYFIGALIVIVAFILIYMSSIPDGSNIEKSDYIGDVSRALIADPSFSASNSGLHPFFKNYRDSFYIGTREVTIDQYRKFCDAKKRNLPPQPASSSGSMPVTNITWDEASAFCKWLGGRLPTEAEWAYAASAGLSENYSGGNKADDVAVYKRQKPRPVATKRPNAFGLYDMTGNVAEWCSDWYDSSHTARSVRGGGYNSKINPVNELAITYRSKAPPEIRSPYIGFRVAWDTK